MYAFASLKQFDPELLLPCFIRSFAQDPLIGQDQTMPLDYWKAIGIDYEVSYGIFYDQQLVGFVLHAPFEKDLLNHTTAILPEHRGTHLLDQLYAYALPFIKERGFTCISLEVSSDNEIAQRAYSRLSFVKKRKLVSWKGTIPKLDLPPTEAHYLVKDLVIDEDLKRRLHDPSHAQSAIGLERIKSHCEWHELREQGIVTAFSVYRPECGNLIHLDGRYQEDILSLLKHMRLENEPVVMMGIDEQNSRLNQFLNGLGLESFVTTYEMEKSL